LKYIFVLLILLTSGAFAQTAESDLKALLQKYAETYTRGDSTALGFLYSEDALLLPPNRPMLKGRAAIAAFWKQNMGGKLSLTPLLVRAEGNVGYAVGHFAFGSEAPSGKFAVCASRDGKGEWLITADMWNNDRDAN
jgi:ketosteroid isomerase-like protein